MEQTAYLLAFYGDDFTGSTDALEFLSRAGVKTVLFLSPPTADQLKQFEGLQAIGVAGMTRSMPPDEMATVLTEDFAALKALGVQHVHYKVCSTFDSSPLIGSIGKAIDVGQQVFNSVFVPLLVAAPVLGRYCLFGNLFARMGIGSKGQIYRLDRHPSMSKHPVTPADESDLRLHLAKQTTRKTGLVDILQIDQDRDLLEAALQTQLEQGNEVVLFDGIKEEHLTKVGGLMDKYASEGSTLFSVGSSGIEMALGGYWRGEGKITKVSLWARVKQAEAILVISGSCSPVTSGQIQKALASGFAGVAIDTAELIAQDDANELIDKYAALAVQYIREGKSVIVHTCKGTDDERVGAALRAFAAKGFSEQQMRSETARLFGTALGAIADRVLDETTVQRLIIAGGDTSSYAARALGIEAVEMIAPIVPGAPLCRAYAAGKAIDQLEVNIKGGQVGDEDYFLTVLNPIHNKS